MYIYYHSRLIRSNMIHHENNWFLEKTKTRLCFANFSCETITISWKFTIQIWCQFRNEMEFTENLSILPNSSHIKSYDMILCTKLCVIVRNESIHEIFIKWLCLKIWKSNVSLFLKKFFVPSFHSIIAFMPYLHSVEKFSVKSTP